jgi:hypothetical protein
MPKKRFERFCIVFMRLTPDEQKPDLEYWAFKVVVCQETGTGQQSKELHIFPVSPISTA